MSEGQDLIHQGVPPLPPRYRFRDLIWGEHALSDEGDRLVRVFHFVTQLCVLLLDLVP